MIVGFSKHGRERAGKAVGYLVDRVRKGIERRPAPTVLRGDPTLITELIDSLPFKHRYTSGVLSFAPGEVVTPDVEQKIMDRFEATAFAGLEPDRYAILWVRHEHAGHHELNFLVARIELETGKSLNIAPPGDGSRKLFDAFRSVINVEFGFSDPDDPERAQIVAVPQHVAKLQAANRRAGLSSKLDPRETITQSVLDATVRGELHNRADVLAFLTRSGFEINRESEEYISVRDSRESHGETSKPYRLKGPLFHEGFNAAQLTSELRSSSLERTFARHKRSSGLREELKRRAESRAAYHKDRYGESITLARDAPLVLPDIVPEITLQQTVEAVADEWNAGLDSQLSGPDGRERGLGRERRHDSGGTRTLAADKPTEEAARRISRSGKPDGTISGDPSVDSRQPTLPVRQRQISVRESEGIISNDRDRASALDSGNAFNERIRAIKSRLHGSLRRCGERFDQAIRRYDEASEQHDQAHRRAQSNVQPFVRAGRLLEQAAEQFKGFVKDVKERLMQQERTSRSRGMGR